MLPGRQCVSVEHNVMIELAGIYWHESVQRLMLVREGGEAGTENEQWPWPQSAGLATQTSHLQHNSR